MRRAAIGGVLMSLGLLSVAQADWIDDANARIEQHRKAPLTVTVVDAAGNAVPATINVRQTASAFRWGSAVNSNFYMTGGTGTNATQYRAKIAQLFNQATLENGHKWRQWEMTGDRNRSIATIDALLAQGKTIRGHTMVWQRPENLPDDVNVALSAGNVTAAVDRTMNHIAAIGSANAGRVSEWDVVNEQWAHNGITSAAHPGVPIEQAPLLAQWFNAARVADPSATLYINDYGILASNNSTNTSHQQSLFDTVSYLKSQNAPIGGIGLQSHFGSANARTSGPNLITILDRFASLGVELQVTEFDMYGSGWTPQSQADYIREFMTAVFSHPAVVGFNIWGFWDGQHFAGSAPLFDANWNLKPSGAAWMDLVFEQWRTNIYGLHGSDGAFDLRAFLGEYEIDIIAGDVTRTIPLSLGVNGTGMTVVVPEPAATIALPIGALLLGRRFRTSAVSRSRQIR